MPVQNQECVLIVDDDKIIAEYLKAGLSEYGYFVVTANRSETALEEFKKHFFHVVVTDLVLPDIQGIDLMRILHKKSPETCFVISTGYASTSTAIEALKLGAYDYIMKPFDIEHLRLVVKRGIEKQQLVTKNKELVDRLEKEKFKLEIIVDSFTMMAGIFNLDDLADFTTNKAVQIMEAEKASLMIVDESTNELVIKGTRGSNINKSALRVKVGELISGWVAKEGKSLVVADIETDPRFRQFAKNSDYNTKSFISIPLKTDSKIIGVMNVTDKLAGMRIFTDDDLRFLSLLAHEAVTQIENIRLYEKLGSLAVTDALTGLLNHRYFQEAISREIQRALRYKHNLSIMMLDVDFFKTYNDQYGHQEGDRVLRTVANIIKENVRQVDICCRYGGDELVIILPYTDLNGAKTVAEKIRKSAASKDWRTQDTNKKMNVTLSGGIASYSTGINKEELVKNVDSALYQAKAQGRNKIVVFDKENI